jgi:hypothetical protein
MTKNMVKNFCFCEHNLISKTCVYQILLKFSSVTLIWSTMASIVKVEIKHITCIKVFLHVWFVIYILLNLFCLVFFGFMGFFQGQ